MSVDYYIIGLFQVAVLLHIGYAIVAVRFVKGVLQIKIRIARRLHDRIIDIGAINRNPAHKVRVLLIDGGIFFIGS